MSLWKDLLLGPAGVYFLVQILQKVTDEYMKKIDSIQKQKEQVLFDLSVDLLSNKTYCLLVLCSNLKEDNRHISN